MKFSLVALLSWHLTLLEDARIEAFSAVPAPVQHVKSRFSISEFSQHHQPRRLSRLRESSSEVDAADIWQETPENDDDESSSQHTFSKAKWKKKRYLMMNDVAGLIERGDPRAPRKAQEIIHRMEKLAEIHNDEDLRPTIQAYNVSLIHWCTACIFSMLLLSKF